jgi:hypothetical protein
MINGSFDQGLFSKDVFKDEYLRDYFNQYEIGAETMAHWGEKTEEQQERLRQLGVEMRTKGINEMKKYGKETEKVTNITKRLNGT